MSRNVIRQPTVIRALWHGGAGCTTIRFNRNFQLLEQRANQLGAGHPQAPRSVAMAKYHTALAAGRIVDAAVQIFGGSGYIEESAVARHYRDVRVLRIGGGADEIQLEILSRELMP